METNTSKKEENIIIKPHFKSFIFLGSPSLIIFGILAILSLLPGTLDINGKTGNDELGLLYFAPSLFFIIFGILIFLWRLVKYKKESYTLTDRKIIYKNGNLFTDNEVEINLDRIVQVKNTLGFIQNKIFKTGNIQIKTAGSSDSTVYFYHISKTIEIYEAIKNRMQKNGFNLKMDKLVQLEKPHWLGIVGEVFGKALGGILFLAYLAYSAYVGMKEEGIEYSEVVGEYSGNVEKGTIGFVLVAIILVGVFALFKYLDLKKREYKIFTDTITYNEGFLTKHHSFIPMENISDTENTQGFFSKIFGLHDVVISSAGNNNKVSFKNMLNGEKMMETVKVLKDETILGEKDKIEGEEKTSNSLIGFKNTMEEALDYDKQYEDTFTISKAKTLFPLLILLIPPFTPAFFVIGLYSLIEIFATKFIISKSSIEKRFEFINTKHNSFSVEKITGVVIKESLIDKLFKTCSIKFWSIGNGSDITFKNIKKTPDLEEKILAKLGIKKENLQKNIESQLNFMDYIKSNIGVFIIFSSIYIISIIISLNLPYYEIFGLEFIGFEYTDLESIFPIIITGFFMLISFLILLRYFYTKFYYSPFRYINKIYSDCIESIQGFFIVTKSYSLFRNIKGTKARKYPLTKTGNLTFDIAGEQVYEDKKSKQNLILIFINLLTGRRSGGKVVTSNKIKLKFIKNIFENFEENDEILNKEEVEKESILTSKQDIGNSIFGSVIFLILLLVGVFSIVIFGDLPKGGEVLIYWVLVLFIIFFLIIIGIKVWTIKVKFYDYQRDRILFSSGIIYKQRHSISYKKFNYIEFNKGFINKVFKNGNIRIYTLGSGSIDLLIKDIPNYREVYDLFRKD